MSALQLVGSGYAIVRYRAALIPLPRRWHVAAPFAMAAASGLYIGAETIGASAPLMAAVGALVLVIWTAAVGPHSGSKRAVKWRSVGAWSTIL